MPPEGSSEEQEDTPFLADLKRMMLAIQTKPGGWTEVARNLVAKYRHVGFCTMEAEMWTMPESECRPAIVAVMDLLKRQSSLSEEELLAGLSACILLAIDRKRQKRVTREKIGIEMFKESFSVFEKRPW